ncbi:carboxymuconolactone decarboxylase family protein [Acidobacteriota bacterium]
MKSFKVAFVLIGLVLMMMLVACDSVHKASEKPVRLQQPRIFPLPESQWNMEQVRLLAPFKGEDGTILNVLTTLGRHPELLDSYMKFILYVASRSTLPARHREILMLRIGWLCQSKYEFGQHTRIGKEAGLTDEDIVRITKGPEDPGWSRFEATLIRAVDELYMTDIISDATWIALSEQYDEKQCLDVIITVGQYNLVSWTLNSLGVQLEEGVPGFPKGEKK